MQHQAIAKTSGIYDGRSAGGMLGLTLSTPPRAPRFNQQGKPAQERTPLYDVGYNMLESLTPPTLSFFDQFSAPRSAPWQLDIFWIDSNAFIICSAQALDKWNKVVEAHKMPSRARTFYPTANLCVHNDPQGPRAKYLGMFEMACTRERTRLSDTDKHASTTVLRLACSGKNLWKPTSGILELCAGRQAEVHVVRLEYLKEDEALLKVLRPKLVGWV